jgi:hypothetical protein
MSDIKRPEEFEGKLEKMSYIIQAVLTGFAVLAGALTAYPNIPAYLTLPIASGLAIAAVVLYILNMQNKTKRYKDYVQGQVEMEKAKLHAQSELNFIEKVQAPGSAQIGGLLSEGKTFDKVIRMIEDDLKNDVGSSNLKDGYTDLLRRVKDMKRGTSLW